jgi:Ni,Fe-hydrogenase III large subunit/Ni,Fe-hydrogenase III component G
MSRLQDIVIAALGTDAIQDGSLYPSSVISLAVPREKFAVAAKALKKDYALLAAEWASDETLYGRGFGIYACYRKESEYLIIKTSAPANDPTFPSLTKKFVPAYRFERQMRSLMGVIPVGHPDPRPWIKHEDWPEDAWPLRKSFDASKRMSRVYGEYRWVRAEGEGVYEIPVGPVHAGIIEPGHFRFSVVGEKVLRLELQLGYVHKGIDRRFTEMAPLEAHRLAGRVSGDSTVAFAWAYCMALEAAAGCAPPARAQWLRAVLLERERVANHLGDLGALGNDAAFGVGLAQFSRLREDWLRLSMALFGHRLMMDRIVPGGVAVDLDAHACRRLVAQCDALEPELRRLRSIYDEHAGLQDRFIATGCVTPQLAAQLGLTGLAGRASGQAWDLRCNPSHPPYDRLDVRMASHRNGDVAARVTVRFDEVLESLRLLRALCQGLPAGPVQVELPRCAGPAIGAGWVEGWRGEVFVALELDSDDHIRRCHCHDPSWHNWPVLEHAVIGNIVPDFPLINKSFNLSYSGHDL